MSIRRNISLTVQQLRAEAHRFFGELKTDLHALEDDLAELDHDLSTLDTLQEKVAHDIEILEERAVEHVEKELIELLNEADEEAEFEMGMG